MLIRRIRDGRVVPVLGMGALSRLAASRIVESRGLSPAAGSLRAPDLASLALFGVPQEVAVQAARER